MERRKLVAGNWKMHGSMAALGELDAIASAAAEAGSVDVAICPPFTLIAAAKARAPGLAIGAQDVHCNPKGAHTGCVSADMLKEAGASLVIVGHSERRGEQREDDAAVRAKAEAALAAGLSVILCVGESEGEREAGRAVETVAGQVDASLPRADVASGSIPDRLAVAYEPIWAIGTGKTATPGDVAEMHAAVRDRLRAAYREAGEGVRILYGGSVKASNAAELFAVADVDGALVGGASLSAGDFVPIIDAARRVAADAAAA